MLKADAKLVWKGSGPARRIAVTKAVAQAALDSQVIKDTNPLVPFRTGMLATSPDRTWGKMGTIILRQGFELQKNIPPSGRGLLV